MDDPLLREHPGVKQHRPEVEQITNDISILLQKLHTVNTAVTAGLDKAKEAKTQAADEAASDAENKKREAAETSLAAEAVRPEPGRGRDTKVKPLALAAGSGAGNGEQQKTSRQRKKNFTSPTKKQKGEYGNVRKSYIH